MKGWWKCSSGRASDVRWAGLSFAARGLLATLEDAADGSGSVPMPDGTEALARVVGGWQGADQVLLLLAELERAGRVVVDHEGRQLLLPHAVREDELRKPAPRARAVAADDGAEEHTGRRKVTRAHKLYFARRERCWRDVPAGVTFDAWLATPEGVLWLDGGTGDGTPESVPRNGGGTFRGTGRNGGGTPLPSHTLPSQKEQRDRENASDAGAHEPGDTPDAERTDPSRNGGGTFRGTHTERNAERSATVPPPRCATVEMTTARGDNSNLQPIIPTVERVGEAFDTLDLLSKMSVASDGLVSMTAGSSAEVSAFAGAVRGYLANGATLASVVAATAHLQHGHWTQRQRRTVLPVARLTAPGPGGRASVLSDLMAEATTCARCKGGEAPPKPAPTPVTRPPRLTREQMEAARDAAKERPCV